MAPSSRRSRRTTSGKCVCPFLTHAGKVSSLFSAERSAIQIRSWARGKLMGRFLIDQCNENVSAINSDKVMIHNTELINSDAYVSGSHPEKRPKKRCRKASFFSSNRVISIIQVAVHQRTTTRRMMEMIIYLCKLQP